MTRGHLRRPFKSFKYVRPVTGAATTQAQEVSRMIEHVGTRHNILNNIDQKVKLDTDKAAATHPPGHPAELGQLASFSLPEVITGSQADLALGKAIVDSWRKDGILQVTFPPGLRVLKNAIQESKKFF